MTASLHERLSDLLFLVAYVRRNQGASLVDVAKRLGVPQSQVLAYIDTLMMCGKPPFSPADMIDIWYEPEEGVHVELDQRLGRPLRLTHQEALALSVSLRGLVESGAPPHTEVAAAVLDKIRAKTTEDISRKVEGLEQRIVLDGEQRATEDRFAVLSRALDEKREVEITYYTASRDEMSTRCLRPYGFIQQLGYWYVVGQDDRHDEPRIFKVERIKEAKLLDDHFDVPRSFDLEKYRKRRLFFAGSERQARVRFSPDVARIVTDGWSETRLTREPDGSVVASLEFVNVEGLAKWLLSFGNAVEVLEPEDLRAEIIARCRSALGACS